MARKVIDVVATWARKNENDLRTVLGDAYHKLVGYIHSKGGEVIFRDEAGRPCASEYSVFSRDIRDKRVPAYAVNEYLNRICGERKRSSAAICTTYKCLIALNLMPKNTPIKTFWQYLTRTNEVPTYESVVQSMTRYKSKKAAKSDITRFEECMKWAEETVSALDEDDFWAESERFETALSYIDFIDETDA